MEIKPNGAWRNLRILIKSTAGLLNTVDEEGIYRALGSGRRSKVVGVQPLSKEVCALMICDADEGSESREGGAEARKGTDATGVEREERDYHIDFTYYTKDMSDLSVPNFDTIVFHAMTREEAEKMWREYCDGCGYRNASISYMWESGEEA